MKPHAFVRAGLASLAGLLASQIVSAAQPAAFPKPLDLATQEKVAELAAASRAAGGVDLTPPELTRLRVRGQLDANVTDQFIEVDVGIDDNRSGVYGYYLSLRAPSGATMLYGPGVRLPTRSYRAKLEIGNFTIPGYGYAVPPFTRYSEPGTWTIDAIYLYDQAGNGRNYTSSELGTFGNLAFNVSNTSGFDTTAPMLQSGVIGTKTISLADAPAGMPAGTAPFVHADLTVSDTGSGAVAGLAAATMYFCHPASPGECDSTLWLYGEVPRHGAASSVVRPSTQLYGPPLTGKYQLHSVYITDWAGNTTYLTSTQFGGLTDFSSYFPSTTLTIKP